MRRWQAATATDTGPNARSGLLVWLLLASIVVESMAVVLWLAGSLPRPVGIGAGIIAIGVDLYTLWIWLAD